MSTQALPPWWLGVGVKPEGKEEEVGTHTELRFSSEQQEEFGINEKGEIQDQEKHDAKLASLKEKPSTGQSIPGIEESPPPSGMTEGPADGDITSVSVADTDMEAKAPTASQDEEKSTVAVPSPTALQPDTSSSAQPDASNNAAPQATERGPLLLDYQIRLAAADAIASQHGFPPPVASPPPSSRMIGTDLPAPPVQVAVRPQPPIPLPVHPPRSGSSIPLMMQSPARLGSPSSSVPRTSLLHRDARSDRASDTAVAVMQAPPPPPLVAMPPDAAAIAAYSASHNLPPPVGVGDAAMLRELRTISEERCRNAERRIMQNEQELARSRMQQAELARLDGLRQLSSAPELEAQRTRALLMLAQPTAPLPPPVGVVVSPQSGPISAPPLPSPVRLTFGVPPTPATTALPLPTTTAGSVPPAAPLPHPAAVSPVALPRSPPRLPAPASPKHPTKPSGATPSTTNPDLVNRRVEELMNRARLRSEYRISVPDLKLLPAHTGRDPKTILAPSGEAPTPLPSRLFESAAPLVSADSARGQSPNRRCPVALDGTPTDPAP